MEVLAYIILGFTFIQFITVLVNLFFPQKLKFTKITNNPFVSVLIPARNEEHNIANILKDLKTQTYSNIEILVYDDNSTDQTANIVLQKSTEDSRIKLIKSNELPKNWLGKNYACHNLANKATGEYLMFLDADVRLKTDLIQKTIAYAQKFNLGLLSIFPKQIMKTAGEKATVPLMHFILTTLLPLILVRKSPYTSHSAANGQFMLFDAGIYKKLMPHKVFMSHKVEDILISRFFKSKKIPISCITGIDEISCRMYTGYVDALNGFSKNIVMFFGNSYLLTFMFWAINTFGIVFMLYFGDNKLLILYSILLIIIRISFSLASKQNIITNIIFWIPQLLSMFIMILKSIIYKITKKQKWKGRYI